MLDPKTIRQDPEAVRVALARRGYRFDVDQFLALEERRKTLQLESERLQNERNTKSKSIGQAKASGRDIQPLLDEVADLGARLDAAKAAFDVAQSEVDALFLSIPNLPDASVPDGQDETANVELRTWSEPTQLNFPPLDHVDLGARGALDFESAARMSGARFVVIRGALARLQRALTQFMLDLHVAEHGYTEVYVPYLVNSDALFGTGQLPKFADDQFRIAGDHDLYLIPTAEVPVTNLYREQILDAERLPIRHVCHTPCFRSEAGSYGRDTRGMIRQHQFEKVEIVQIVAPERSWQAHDELTSHAEAVLKRLDILQTDGYQAYEGVGGTKIVHVGCWAHSRRKFVDAVKVNPQDGEAVKMVTRMDALFLVDRDARQKAMSGAARLTQRRELAQPWVEEIRETCRTLSKEALPKSALGKAVAYTLNQWPKLVRCLEYEKVELSNNLAENSMRPVALGRKNWLHVGSVKAGPKVAAILSVVESCRRIGAPVKEYLAGVLPGLDRRRLGEVATLTPARWIASRG